MKLGLFWGERGGEDLHHVSIGESFFKVTSAVKLQQWYKLMLFNHCCQDPVTIFPAYTPACIYVLLHKTTNNEIAVMIGWHPWSFYRKSHRKGVRPDEKQRSVSPKYSPYRTEEIFTLYLHMNNE